MTLCNNDVRRAPPRGPRRHILGFPAGGRGFFCFSSVHCHNKTNWYDTEAPRWCVWTVVFTDALVAHLRFSTAPAQPQVDESTRRRTAGCLATVSGCGTSCAVKTHADRWHRSRNIDWMLMFLSWPTRQTSAAFLFWDQQHRLRSRKNWL